MSLNSLEKMDFASVSHLLLFSLVRKGICSSGSLWLKSSVSSEESNQALCDSARPNSVAPCFVPSIVNCLSPGDYA